MPDEDLFPGSELYPHLGGGQGFSWFEVELTSENVGPGGEIIPDSQGLRLGGLITSGGGIPITAGEEEEFLVPGVFQPVSELVPVSFSISGRISAHEIVELRIEGRTRTSRDLTLSVQGLRREGKHWKAALDDDEAVLLAL